MRVVAVSGQWIELQCPLVSELMPLASSSSPASSHIETADHHSIQWRKNGIRLDQLNPRYKINQTNGTLVIANSQPKVDEANYECLLIKGGSNQDDHEQRQRHDLIDEPQALKSHRLELRLLVAPRVAPFEAPADAQVGMKLVLTCSVLEGQQPISFIWLKDNKIIADQQRPSHASHQTSSLAQLHQQQLADKYALMGPNDIALPISSGYSSSSSSSSKPDEAYLSGGNNETTILLLPPAPLKQLIDSGESIKSANQQQQQQLLPLLSDANIRVRQSDDYSILSIDKLELKHSGRYTCSAQNEAARASHSSQLLINAPPTLTVIPRDADLVSGQSAVIECAASGQPRPSISWLRARETNSKQWDYVAVYDNLRYTSLQNGSLAIANITQREQGFYLCSAKNQFGTELSKLVKISVHEPAKFSAKYKTVEVRIEESATMVCMASGELPLSIEWRNKDGNPIQLNDKRFIIDNESHDIEHPKQGDSNNLPVNATISRLILAKSQRSDSGHFTCYANNKFGSDKMITNLLVQDVPDKVTDLKVTNTTSSTISIRWQLAFSGNTPLTSYLIQYKYDDPLDDLLTSTSGISQQQQSKRSAILSQQLESETALDSSDKTTSSPLKVALEALNLAVASNIESAAEAIDRTVVELTVEQSATHLVVKDLSPYCVYRLRLAGINKIGLGEFSDWIRAKTDEAPPGGSASKIVAAATGPNSVKVTWSPPDRRSWNGQLIGFNIGYRPIDSSFELNKTIEWSPPTLQSMVLDARNKQLAEATTTAAPKQQQQQQQLEVNKGAKNGSSSNASTNEPNNLSRYSLRQHLRQLLALQQQELVAHLTNLQRSSTYLVWIQAINARGFGPQSHAISVKTLDDVPPSAPAIKIQSTDSNSITIAWSMLSNFVSSANQYSLFYRKINHQPTSRVNSSSSSSLAESAQLAESNLDSNPSSFAGIMNHQTTTIMHQPNNNPDIQSTFTERSITSQQLMASGSVMFASGNEFEHAPSSNGDLKLTSSNFMHHHHQQGQHYQQFVYTLDGLDCGSVYELYMSTRNSVGKSEPSLSVSTRTKGEPPLAPINKNNFFSKIGINEVALNLAAWSTGGCPITDMRVRYKQSPMPVASASSSQQQQQQQTINQMHSNNSSAAQPNSALSISWPTTTSVPINLLSSLNSQQLPSSSAAAASRHLLAYSSSDVHVKASAGSADQSPVYYLKNLIPSSCYELEVIAYNSAGHTSAQYEFVTSNQNGTRVGYSRREGVYRIEQSNAGSAYDQMLIDGSGRASIEQQISSYQQNSSAQQILPLLLMLLCLICLLISSAFCYHRLAGTWKLHRQRRRRNSSDTSSRSQQAANSSPNSIGGKSSMWGVGDTGGQYEIRHGTTMNISRQLQSNNLAEQHGNGSPTATLHYCMREPPSAGGQTLAKSQMVGSFSQSVSMKDFNGLASSSSSKLPSNCTAATLNYKNYRTSMRNHQQDNNNNYKTTTLRARLFSEGIEAAKNQSFVGPSLNNQDQICAAGHSINRDGENNYALNGNHEQANNQQMSSDLYGGFNYAAAAGHDNQQLQQETSWTNYHPQRMDQTANTVAAAAAASATTTAAVAAYAIPTATNYSEQVYDHYGARQEPVEYHNNQSSIDACIQQLIGQQYQQQQQPYSMVMNFKANNPEHCLYDTTKNLDDHSGHRAMATQCKQQASVVCPPPVMDSSSSSSGIDAGTHLECASTTTGTSNSNTSNEIYPSTRQHQFNGSDYNAADSYPMPNVMMQQQLNDSSAASQQPPAKQVI